MKRTAFCITLILLSRTLFAQAPMTVYLKTGECFQTDVDSIVQIAVTRDTTKWPRYSMDVFVDSTMFEYRTTKIDSLSFEPWRFETVTFAVYQMWKQFQTPDTLGADHFPNSHIDSITFPANRVITDTADTAYVRIAPWTYWDTFSNYRELGTIYKAIWHDSTIVCTVPLSTIHILPEQEFDSLNLAGRNYPFYLTPDTERNHVLGVYNYDGYGRIARFDLRTGEAIDLDTSDGHCSSVRVFPGTDSLIYYTYSPEWSAKNPYPKEAGYYIFNRRTGEKKQILHHISSLGPKEMINGFDIRQDGKKLLIPDVGHRMPRIIEYDLETQRSDTLAVPFASAVTRVALWLRYNHDGSKILYGSYPLGSFNADSPVFDSSEIGIIDRKTLQKNILYVNPSVHRMWLNVFPEWSPLEDQILFTSTSTTLDQYTGLPLPGKGYKVFILKSLE